MGKVGSTLFGKPSKTQQTSSSTSLSQNLAYPAVSKAMTPALGYTTQGGDMMANLLGLSGGPAQTEGLNAFANSGGMDFLREQGNKQINSNQAGRGLFNSGETGIELEKYGQGLGSTYLNSFMDKLSNLSNLGIGSANAISGTGQTLSSTSSGSGSGTGEKKGLLSGLSATKAF